MSALDALWLWLQQRTLENGNNARMSPRAESPGKSAESNHAAGPVYAQKARDTQARIVRHCRYRAGPWQMK